MLGDAPAERLHRIARGLVEGAHRALEGDARRDHVVGRAAVDRADRDHRRFDRIDLAADDALQASHYVGGNDDRIDRPLRHRTVAAHTPTTRANEATAGINRAGRHAHAPGGKTVVTYSP